jgi:hypothetical protein
VGKNSLTVVVAEVGMTLKLCVDFDLGNFIVKVHNFPRILTSDIVIRELKT